MIKAWPQRRFHPLPASICVMPDRSGHERGESSSWPSQSTVRDKGKMAHVLWIIRSEYKHITETLQRPFQSVWETHLSRMAKGVLTQPWAAVWSHFVKGLGYDAIWPLDWRAGQQGVCGRRPTSGLCSSVSSENGVGRYNRVDTRYKPYELIRDYSTILFSGLLCVRVCRLCRLSVMGTENQLLQICSPRSFTWKVN